jgi:hypothetical protein
LGAQVWLFGPFLMGLAAEPASKRVLTFAFVLLSTGFGPDVVLRA